MGLGSQGIKFFWSASTGVSTAVLIGEITDFTGPGGAAAVIDITHLLSTAKEKLMGLRDEGQLSFNVNFNATDAGQEALRTDRAARNKKNGSIKFTDETTSFWYFDAYCLNYSIAGAVDQKVSAAITLEIDGPITESTK